MKTNPFEARVEELKKLMKEKNLDSVLIFNQANVRGLTGIDCDNACFTIDTFYTDFRYIPMVHRCAPYLKDGDIKKIKVKGTKVGYEGSISAAKLEELKKKYKKVTEWVDIGKEVKELRAIKTADEIEKLRAAEKLNDEIWSKAQAKFKAGMTEREMARVIQHLMIDLGEGEAFETIVCVGKNAAECHHVPDDTVWNGKEPVLVDMGVKLNGYCSDMTRNIVPEKPSKLYKKVYDLVLEANMLAIKAAKPGMTSGALDKVARDFLTEKGYGEAFGHSLGHGVGIEIHEAPWAAKKQKTKLVPGMLVTIEPGIYLEDNLGVRIEDLILITEDGCEVLSHSKK